MVPGGRIDKSNNVKANGTESNYASQAQDGHIIPSNNYHEPPPQHHPQNLQPHPPPHLQGQLPEHLYTRELDSNGEYVFERISTTVQMTAPPLHYYPMQPLHYQQPPLAQDWLPQIPGNAQGPARDMVPVDESLNNQNLSEQDCRSHVHTCKACDLARYNPPDKFRDRRGPFMLCDGTEGCGEWTCTQCDLQIYVEKDGLIRCYGVRENLQASPSSMPGSTVL